MWACSAPLEAQCFNIRSMNATWASCKRLSHTITQKDFYCGLICEERTPYAPAVQEVTPRRRGLVPDLLPCNERVHGPSSQSSTPRLSSVLALRNIPCVRPWTSKFIETIPVHCATQQRSDDVLAGSATKHLPCDDTQRLLSHFALSY